MKPDLWFSILWLGLILGITFRTVLLPRPNVNKGFVVLHEWMMAGLFAMALTLCALASVMLCVLHHPWQSAILWLAMVTVVVAGYLTPWPPTRRDVAVSADMLTGRGWPNIWPRIPAFLLKTAVSCVGFQLLAGLVASPLLSLSPGADMKVFTVVAVLDVVVLAAALSTKQIHVQVCDPKA